MILAAGRGERLRPLTDHTPKPLLQAGGKALIEHTLESLVQNGFSEIIINLAHLGEQIQQKIGDGSRYQAQINYIHEGASALETGGGIYHALPALGPDQFLVVNGDIASDYPFEALKKPIKSLAHLILTQNPPHHPKGDFALQDGRVIETGEPLYTFTGIGVYRPELFDGCQPGKFPLAPLLREAMAKGQVTGEVYPGFWLDIGTIERLQTFDEKLNRCAETAL